MQEGQAQNMKLRISQSNVSFQGTSGGDGGDSCDRWRPWRTRGLKTAMRNH